ncbi:MAG TPA: alpha/beta hydrolase domain-containing protein, partial [Polyangiaceae bacterium]
RPAGPAADVSEELSGGNGPFIGAATGLAVPDGYVEHEYVASGTATDYEAKGALTDDGQWTLDPGTTAAYRTRVLIRRPAKAADSSGTVIVEWLNVSGGIDANPDYASLEEEITRQGHTWVGVSAQLIGVEGGPVLVKVPGTENMVGKGLKALDPARYASLAHPGDGYSFDIFTQVTRALLAGGPALGGAKPRFVLAAGESQSAFALTTYYDGVQPLTLAFDGFLVHSRGGVSLPLVAPGASADLTGAIGSTVHPVFRDDLDAPVLDIQAESDVTGVLNSSLARQPESDRFRLWEVAGTAHADVHLLGSAGSGIDCGVPINNGPMHLVAKAALRGLNTWVTSGTLPPIAPRLELETSNGAATVSRDADGIALGGIRTPPVDVPVDTLSGVRGPKTDLICILLGSTKPLPDARLAELYPTRAVYQEQYDAHADATIRAGFVLEPDRAALLAFAQPSRVSP